MSRLTELPPAYNLGLSLTQPPAPHGFRLVADKSKELLNGVKEEINIGTHGFRHASGTFVYCIGNGDNNQQV